MAGKGTVVVDLLKRFGKKKADESNDLVKKEQKLDKLKNVDYPSEKQKDKMQALIEDIRKQKAKEKAEIAQDKIKKSGSTKTGKRTYKGKPLDMSMAMNRGGMTMRKGNMAYSKGGSTAKPRTGSMDYRKGGMISSTKSKK
jgi:hypothetical protein